MLTRSREEFRIRSLEYTRTTTNAGTILPTTVLHNFQLLPTKHSVVYNAMNVVSRGPMPTSSDIVNKKLLTLALFDVDSSYWCSAICVCISDTNSNRFATELMRFIRCCRCVCNIFKLMLYQNRTKIMYSRCSSYVDRTVCRPRLCWWTHLHSNYLPVKSFILQYNHVITVSEFVRSHSARSQSCFCATRDMTRDLDAKTLCESSSHRPTRAQL